MSDTRKTTKPNVPNLRFPGFEGEWARCTLGEIGEPYIGLTYSPADVVSEGGTIVFRSSNIQNGEIDYSDIVRVNKIIKDSIITRKDDLLICARNGSPRLIGKNALLKEADEGQTFGAFMLVFRSNDNHFVHQLLCTKGYNSQVSENLGARINQITTSNIRDFEFCFPQSTAERNKIAGFLDLIDERIAVQSRLIEDLKKLRCAVSNKLFQSVKGVVIPLSGISNIVKGKQINGDFLAEVGEYYVMNGGTEPSGYYDNYNVEANTISISEGGNSCGYVQFNRMPFWSGGHCYTIQDIVSDVETLYLYHYLKSKEDSIMKLRIGTGLPNIQKKDLAEFKVIIPAIEQQRTISNILSLLERKTEIEGRMLIAMRTEKQYLLHQMFI